MAQQQAKGAVQIDPRTYAQVRHPLKAAALIYSAPGFILRGPIYMVFIIMVVGLAYSIWAKKDVLVTAPLTLHREAVTVQVVGSGMVYDVLTANNALINAGDTIAIVQEQIRAASNPEQEKLVGDIDQLRDDIKNKARDYDHQINQLQLELEDVGKTRTTELAAQQAQINQVAFQIKSARSDLVQAQRKLELAQSRFKTKAELFKTKDITITEYEEAQEAVADLEKQVSEARNNIHKHQLSLNTAQQELKKLEALHSTERIKREMEQAKKNREVDLKDMAEKLAGLEKKAGEMDTLVQGVSYAGNLARYKSNFDGVVSEVHIKKGELVDSGTPLATIVKDTAALEARVFVENRDIGNIKHGQGVKLKYFAYPYQEYGIQRGVISEIATKPSNEPGRESKYLIKVALESETIKAIHGPTKKLSIGLEGFAEIKTGDKRLIELLFSPVSKFFKGETDPGSGGDGGGSGSGSGGSGGE